MTLPRLVLAPILAIALGCLSTAAAPASASGGDTAATQAYLRANLKLVKVASSHLAASEQAPLSEVLDKVRQECPQAGLKSPQNASSTHMSYEVIGAIVIAAYKPDLTAAREYVRAVKSLHWSDAKITQEVRTHAQSLTTVAALAPPNLCADVRAWGATGYATLPPSTVEFDQKFEPSWVSIGTIPEGLGRVENAATKTLARQNEQVEAKLFEGEARVTETSYETIMDELDLWP
jgi:hypothetical protein